VRIKGVGKLVAAFVFFLGASGLAIHEAKPPAPPRQTPAARVVAPAAGETAPPSRAIHDEVPPWVKYAPPPARAIAAPPPPTIIVEPPPRVVITLDDGETDDVPDVSDKCPDQPSGDDDGCPEREIIID